MGLDLLPGEGVNAFTADMQDASGKLYLLKVEFHGTGTELSGNHDVHRATELMTSVMSATSCCDSTCTAWK
jgi:hypothetical protein